AGRRVSDGDDSHLPAGQRISPPTYQAPAGSAAGVAKSPTGQTRPGAVVAAWPTPQGTPPSGAPPGYPASAPGSGWGAGGSPSGMVPPGAWPPGAGDVGMPPLPGSAAMTPAGSGAGAFGALSRS